MIKTTAKTLLWTGICILWVSGSGWLAGDAYAGSERPELVLQTGHNKLVRSIVVGPDRNWIATGSFDGTVRIWSAETGRELRSLAGHQGAVTAIAASPDGQSIASLGTDDTVRVWDVADGSETAVLKLKKNITSLVFIEPKRLACGDAQGRIVISDALTGREVANFSGPAAEVTALSMSRDRRMLLSGAQSGTVSVWDAASGKLSKTLTSLKGKITALAIDPDSALIAAGDDTGSIRLWDLQTGRRAIITSDRKTAIRAVALASPTQLISVDDDGVIDAWEPNAQKSWVRKTSDSNVASAGDMEAAAFSADGSLLVIGKGDGTAAIVDAKTARVLENLDNHTVGFYGVAFSKDGHWLAGAGFDNTVKVWDLRTGDSLAPFTGHTGRVTAVAFASKDRLVSASVDHTLRVWDILSRKCVAVLNGHTNSTSSVAVAGNGSLVISAGADGMIGIWDIDTMPQPRFLSGHKGEVIAVAVSPDNQTIVSTGIDGTVRTWSLKPAKQIAVAELASGEIDAVAFSPDGDFVITGGIDRTLRLWRSKDLSPVRSFTGHSSKINSVAFSPDGRSIVSGGQDRSVRVWDVTDGREIRSASTHAGPVFGIACSSDNRFVASASDDGSIILWNAATGSAAATLLSLRNSGDWLAVTPSGFFDGSPAGWSQLSWRFDNNTFNSKPVEVFFSEYYLPGLLSDLFSGRDLPQLSDLSKRDRRQPEVKMMVAATSAGTGREAHISIDVGSAPAGARDLRLFRNGALVKVWPGDVLAGRANARLDATVPMIAGTNRLTAYAFNNDNVKSSDAVLVLNAPASLKRKGTLHLLSVGVNDYDNREFNLRFATADAEDFANEVRLRQDKINEYEKVELTFVRNEVATKAAIISALRGLSSTTQPEDGVIVYFAGHGIADRNRFYLVPHDIGYKGKRSELNENGMHEILSSSISDLELEAAVRDIDVSQFLLVIDACNSGQALETEEKRRGPMNSKGLAQLAYEKGMYILTAAQSYQAALEAAKLGHGFLTFALIEEGLKTAAADDAPRDGDVTIREWLDFAAARVPQIQQEDLTARELTRDKSSGKSVINERSIQRPRVFYRRETEARPFIVARH